MLKGKNMKEAQALIGKRNYSDKLTSMLAKALLSVLSHQMEHTSKEGDCVAVLTMSDSYIITSRGNHCAYRAYHHCNNDEERHELELMRSGNVPDWVTVYDYEDEGKLVDKLVEHADLRKCSSLRPYWEGRQSNNPTLMIPADDLRAAINHVEPHTGYKSISDADEVDGRILLHIIDRGETIYVTNYGDLTRGVVLDTGYTNKSLPEVTACFPAMQIINALFDDITTIDLGDISNTNEKKSLRIVGEDGDTNTIYAIF